MFHEVTIVGYVGNDPTMRYTPDGVPVTNISVATKETISQTAPDGSKRSCPKGWRASQNGRNWELTTWWRAALWRGLASTANDYLSKGDPVFLKGQMSGDASDGSQNPRVWNNSEGTPSASYEITVRELRLLPKSGGNGSASASAPPDLEEDTLPF